MTLTSNQFNSVLFKHKYINLKIKPDDLGNIYSLETCPLPSQGWHQGIAWLVITPQGKVFLQLASGHQPAVVLPHPQSLQQIKPLITSFTWVIPLTGLGVCPHSTVSTLVLTFCVHLGVVLQPAATMLPWKMRAFKSQLRPFSSLCL